MKVLETNRARRGAKGSRGVSKIRGIKETKRH